VSLEELRSQYIAAQEELAGLAVEISATLKDVTARAGIPCKIDARPKEVASLLKKVLYKNYDEPWSQLTDKVGVRIVVTRASDVDRV
jgi:ppGpp synthetase/RelA/SpoT-type nucleotidyltranferase